MKTEITYKDIINLKACYDPKEIGMPEDYKANIPEFIDEYKCKVKEKEDIIWLLCRHDYMTDKDMRLFGVWCAREALKLVKNPDKRSVEACNVADRFASGTANSDELAAVRDASWAAAMAAVRDAVRAAAMAAVWAAAWDASWAAAMAAARVAARDAASAAARAAAWATVRDAWDAQFKQLKTYF